MGKFFKHPAVLLGAGLAVGLAVGHGMGKKSAFNQVAEIVAGEEAGVNEADIIKQVKAAVSGGK